MPGDMGIDIGICMDIAMCIDIEAGADAVVSALEDVAEQCGIG